MTTWYLKLTVFCYRRMHLLPFGTKTGMELQDALVSNQSEWAGMVTQSNSTELNDEPTHFMSLNSKQRLSPNSLDLWCDQKPPPFLLLISLSSKENQATRTIFHQPFLLKVF